MDPLLGLLLKCLKAFADITLIVERPAYEILRHLENPFHYIPYFPRTTTLPKARLPYKPRVATILGFRSTGSVQDSRSFLRLKYLHIHTQYPWGKPVPHVREMASISPVPPLLLAIGLQDLTAKLPSVSTPHCKRTGTRLG